MNNFTIEELKFILAILDEWYEVHYSKETKEDNILYRSCCISDKLQSMLDNYCEHESDGYCYYKSGTRCTDFLLYASPDSACLLKCKKCNKLFDDGRP